MQVVADRVVDVIEALGRERRDPVDKTLRRAGSENSSFGRTPAFSSAEMYLALVPNTVTLLVFCHLPENAAIVVKRRTIKQYRALRRTPGH